MLAGSRRQIDKQQRIKYQQRLRNLRNGRLFSPQETRRREHQTFVANASLGIDIGDLMYQETDDARPASSEADQLSETLNQALFASKFIGVANFEPLLVRRRRRCGSRSSRWPLRVRSLSRIRSRSATSSGPTESAGGTALEINN